MYAKMDGQWLEIHGTIDGTLMERERDMDGTSRKWMDTLAGDLRAAQFKHMGPTLRDPFSTCFFAPGEVEGSGGQHLGVSFDFGLWH